MSTLKIGTTVKLPKPYLGIVGTIIAYYAAKDQYLVRLVLANNSTSNQMN